MTIRTSAKALQQGFTLVEIIIGLVISTIAISLVSTLIFPLLARSVEPIFQIRAAEFAQAVLEDALSKPYAENTPVGGSPVCSPCIAIGADGESGRDEYDDVDDYHAFCGGSDIKDVFDTTLNTADDYAGFEFGVCVVYDGDYDGIADSNEAAKLITVTVTPPAPAVPVVVSAYRGNY